MTVVRKTEILEVTDYPFLECSMYKSKQIETHNNKVYIPGSQTWCN